MAIRVSEPEVIYDKPKLSAHGEKKLSYGTSLKILPIVVDDSDIERVVVVPEYALASYASGYADPNFIRELPIETVPEDLRGRGTVRKFQVYGDSMEPNIHHGDYIYATYSEIYDQYDLKYKLRQEHIYVLITLRGVMVKRVYWHDNDEFLQCFSDNPKHKAFPMPLGEIKEFWYWRRTYTAQAPKPSTASEEINRMKREIYEQNQRIDLVASNVNKIEAGIERIIKALPGASPDVELDS